MSDLFDDPRKSRKVTRPPSGPTIFRAINHELIAARDTARSTSDLARYAAEQHEENRRLRFLTILLSFAVFYDVVNGSFDHHTWWTTLVSVGAAIVVIGGTLLFGTWRNRRQG